MLHYFPCATTSTSNIMFYCSYLCNNFFPTLDSPLYTILNVERVARQVGIKTTDLLGAHRCNSSQNLVKIFPECRHAQSCEHGQSNYPLFNVCFFNPPAVQLA